jgi:hypothetical protein
MEFLAGLLPPRILLKKSRSKSRPVGGTGFNGGSESSKRSEIRKRFLMPSGPWPTISIIMVSEEKNAENLLIIKSKEIGMAEIMDQDQVITFGVCN